LSLLSKPTDLRNEVIADKSKNKRGDELTTAILMHFEKLHSMDYFPIRSVQELLLKQAQFELGRIGKRLDYPTDLPRFSPSSADKCEREIFYKAVKAPQDETTMYPFQRRWTRNSTAVHEAVQRNLLEAEVKLEDPEFKVLRLPEKDNLPAWEKNLESWILVTNNGVQFVVTGMMDGILEYKDGSRIGFEFKTKSNTVAAIKQLKEPAPSHRQQCVAYSVLFGVDEFVIVYESVAKDKWSTGEDARADMKAFYVKVTEKDRKALLNKWSRVVMNLQDGEVSKPDYGKCTFCSYSTQCSEVNK
jgi:CRISPR/Cas system-associated exonuclease Cas4 (RecB family)